MRKHFSFMLLLVFLFIASIILISSVNADLNDPDKLEIFYINMNSSTSRDILMRAYLETTGYPYQRIEAVTIQGNEHYNLKFAWDPCDQMIDPLIFQTKILNKKKINVTKLCVRKGHPLKLIATDLSHIKAIVTAIASPNANNYALILEDDINLAFDIDFNKYIQTLPIDFAITQLFISNIYYNDMLINAYVNKKRDFVPWDPNFWNIGAYIINKRVLKQHLQPLFDQMATNTDQLVMEVIGGAEWKTYGIEVCWPRHCCDGTTFKYAYPCVRLPLFGYHDLFFPATAPDFYIYSIVPNQTYTSTLPLVITNTEAAITTQSRATYDYHLEQMREIVQDVYSGKIPLPSYLQLRTSSTNNADVGIEVFYLYRPIQMNSIDSTMHRSTLVNNSILTENLLNLTKLGYTNQLVDIVHHEKHHSTSGTGSGTGTVPSALCDNKMESIQLTSTIHKEQHIRITRLCMKKQNTMRDVYKTISHIRAILTAIKSSNILHYAIIVEEGTKLVSSHQSMKKMIENLPKDFGIVQISKSYRSTTQQILNNNISSTTKYSYIKWDPLQSSSSAYIINKSIMKKVFKKMGFLLQKENMLSLDLIAGSEKPFCYPHHCCSEKKFIQKASCVLTYNSSIAPEYFIYSLLPSQQRYKSQIPLAF